MQPETLYPLEPGDRVVCSAGGVVLGAALTNFDAGVDPGNISFAGASAGYLAGSVWAELSMAQVAGNAGT